MTTTSETLPNSWAAKLAKADDDSLIAQPAAKEELAVGEPPLTASEEAVVLEANPTYVRISKRAKGQFTEVLRLRYKTFRTSMVQDIAPLSLAFESALTDSAEMIKQITGTRDIQLETKRVERTFNDLVQYKLTAALLATLGLEKDPTAQLLVMKNFFPEDWAIAAQRKQRNKLVTEALSNITHSLDNINNQVQQTSRKLAAKRPISSRTTVVKSQR